MKKFLLAIPVFVVAACSPTGSTTSGSSGSITGQQMVTIGCALAQVVGDTAGTLAGDVNAGQSAAGTIVKGRKVLDDACASLIQIAGAVAQAKSASVSATTK